MAYLPVDININGRTVHVTTEDLPNEVMSVVITAQCGNYVQQWTHTFSAVDGGLDIPDLAKVQDTLDKTRKRIARKVAHQAALAEMKEQLR